MAKYTPDGGAVTVSLRTVDDGPGEWAELEVADTGIGLAASEKAKLFTNFYRSEHVRRAAIPGTGLGLAITQGFVRAHGGEIEVSSEPGAGSVFSVRIPVGGPPETPGE
ncbi:sensor histidine kinase [Citricoccus sp. GCM10030269]|uniref:sensor histidine kinase n=1 Tax=Citricoccus sp. GCM10030269 TaxID=3273388 RepID=UPI0036071A45